MKVMLFGSSGMVGLGVLRECLLDPSVTEVVSIGRVSVPPQFSLQSPKLREIVRKDLFHLDDIPDEEFRTTDACLFSLGITSVGMKEPDYRRITQELTLSIAGRFVALKPEVAFLYVSGAGTDPAGKSMWQRVKGETENALLALPFRAAFMFRPGAIVPMHGIRSKTALYQLPYTLLAPILPLLARRFPQYVTTTEQLGRAMLRLAKKGVAREGPARRILESADIAAM